MVAQGCGALVAEAHLSALQAASRSRLGGSTGSIGSGGDSPVRGMGPSQGGRAASASDVGASTGDLPWGMVSLPGRAANANEAGCSAGDSPGAGMVSAPGRTTDASEAAGVSGEAGAVSGDVPGGMEPSQDRAAHANEASASTVDSPVGCMGPSQGKAAGASDASPHSRAGDVPAGLASLQGRAAGASEAGASTGDVPGDMEPSPGRAAGASDAGASGGDMPDGTGPLQCNVAGAADAGAFSGPGDTVPSQGREAGASEECASSDAASETFSCAAANASPGAAGIAAPAAISLPCEEPTNPTGGNLLIGPCPSPLARTDTLVSYWTLGSPLPLWLASRAACETAAPWELVAASAPHAPHAPPFPLPHSMLSLGGRFNLWHRADPLGYPIANLPAVAAAVSRASVSLGRVSRGAVARQPSGADQLDVEVRLGRSPYAQVPVSGLDYLGKGGKKDVLLPLARHLAALLLAVDETRCTLPPKGRSLRSEETMSSTSSFGSSISSAAAPLPGRATAGAVVSRSTLPGTALPAQAPRLARPATLPGRPG